MSRLISSVFLYLSLALFFFPHPGNADSRIYTFDPQHSYVVWRVNHLGFSEQVGKWPTEGELIFNMEKPEESRVKATIALNSLITGNPELDKHLKSKEFFDAPQYPEATFVSTKITMTDDKKADIEGNLTLHGVTKPITLTTTFNKQGKNPVTNKEAIGFSAEATLKRSDFGITAFLFPGGGGIGDTVSLRIDVEAYEKIKDKK